MAVISIKDLPRNDDLDRSAMLAIAGGARAGGRPSDPDPREARALRVVDYPPGFGRDEPADASAPRRVR